MPDWSKPIILLLLALSLFFGVRSRMAGVRARRLEHESATLARDLRTMQATLVPVIPDRVGGLAVSVAYCPADGPAAGGDFYDVFALEPTKVAIVLGDVAGHGHDALDRAALTRYTLRAYLQAGLEPRAVLSLAGSVLSEPTDMHYATVIVAIYDGVTGRLTYASGGHPHPIAVGFDTPEPPVFCCSAPVGCDLPTGRRQTTLSLPAKGRVWFFSDGLPEARTSDDDGFLGRERLVEIANELGPHEKASALLERVSVEALATRDDMVACVISPTLTAPASAPHVEELEVDAKSLEGPKVAAFLQVCGVPSTSIERALSSAKDAVEKNGTALMRIERLSDRDATIAVLAGRPTPAPAVVGEARQSAEPALAVPIAQ